MVAMKSAQRALVRRDMYDGFGSPKLMPYACTREGHPMRRALLMVVAMIGLLSTNAMADDFTFLFSDATGTVTGGDFRPPKQRNLQRE
jgi:hypothetical protein